VGCVSCTGHGESITKTCLAITAVNHMKSGSVTFPHSFNSIIHRCNNHNNQHTKLNTVAKKQKICDTVGMSPEEAGHQALETMRSRVGGAGGLILINRLKGGATCP